MLRSTLLLPPPQSQLNTGATKKRFSTPHYYQLFFGQRYIRGGGVIHLSDNKQLLYNIISICCPKIKKKRCLNIYRKYNFTRRMGSPEKRHWLYSRIFLKILGYTYYSPSIWPHQKGLRMDLAQGSVSILPLIFFCQLIPFVSLDNPRLSAMHKQTRNPSVFESENQ